jgi:hypothetical protein
MHTDLDAVYAYCLQQDWRVEDADDTTLWVRKTFSCGLIHADAHVRQERFTFRSQFPVVVPELRRRLMMEFAMQANRDSDYAFMYLDHATGEIGVTTGTPVAMGYLCPAVIDLVVGSNLIAIDRWLPGVAAVCYCDISPKTAIAMCSAPCPIAAAVGEAVKNLESFGDDDDQSSL